MSKQVQIEGIKERLVLLMEKLNVLKLAEIKAIDANVEFKYKLDIDELERTIAKEKQELALLESKDTPSLSITTIKFPLHHQYTCDRISQDEVFMDYVTNPSNISKRLHFFYLHGSRKQEHLGLFKRFCNTVGGRNRALGEEKEEAIKVVELDDFVYPKDRTEERIQVSIALEIIEKLGIKEIDLENISSRNLAYALQNSPKLQGLSEKDKVCCFIRIPSRRWNSELTPKMTLWFIEQFCLRELPSSIPELFFFFSVEYKEADQQTKEELLTAMKNPKHALLFPELAMVEKDDVEDWFDDYRTYWKDDRLQEALMEQHFANEADEMYMADVQDILKNIINNINQSEKDVPRNS